jgi:hypothetical protein
MGIMSYLHQTRQYHPEIQQNISEKYDLIIDATFFCVEITSIPQLQ